jgi:predicted transcriptional regulator
LTIDENWRTRRKGIQPPMKTQSYRLPTTLIDQVNDIADTREVTRSTIVRQQLERFVDEEKPKATTAEGQQARTTVEAAPAKTELFD